MQTPQLILASRNDKKIREIEDLLAPHGIQVTGLSEFPDVADVVEDRDTFKGNAEKKASEIAIQLKQWTLAEDSGLSVDALKGEPGVYSARYAGEAGTREERDRANNQKLVDKLKNVPEEKRTAITFATWRSRILRARSGSIWKPNAGAELFSSRGARTGLATIPTFSSRNTTARSANSARW
jgi:non-canonical purine NTP pyrophosphatase (RdgB/HAM1 family)